MGDNIEVVSDKSASAPAADASEALREETTMKTMKNMVVVCSDNACTPFSTRESGNTDSSQFVDTNFRKFDADGDKALDKEELKAWSDKFTKDSPVQKMTELVIEKFDDVANLVKEEGEKAPDGITKDDFAKLKELKQKDPKDLTEAEAALVNALDLGSKKEEDDKKAQEQSKKEGLFDKFLDF